MAVLKIKNIGGRVRWQFLATFVYYFSMDPIDCRDASWGLSLDSDSLSEAMTSMWIQFKSEHDLSYVKDFKLEIIAVPRSETTITTP